MNTDTVKSIKEKLAPICGIAANRLYLRNFMGFLLMDNRDLASYHWIDGEKIFADGRNRVYGGADEIEAAIGGTRQEAAVAGTRQEAAVGGTRQEAAVAGTQQESMLALVNQLGGRSAAETLVRVLAAFGFAVTAYGAFRHFTK